MQYTTAIIFSKHTDLLPYFYATYNGSPSLNDVQYNRLKAHYETKRDVRLILLMRHDGKNTICRIKCPINPMPIKGEFEVVSMHNIFEFLRQHGWTHHDTYHSSMFN